MREARTHDESSNRSIIAYSTRVRDDNFIRASVCN